MKDATTLRSDWRRILSIDRGSSSLRIAVYEMGPACEHLLLEGGIEQLETPNVELRIRDYRASAIEWTKPDLLSTPMCAFIPKYH